MLGLFALVFLFPGEASALSSYWKNYFSIEERKAVQKNAEKYTISQIESKSNKWKGIIRGYNIKNGSISDDDIEENGITTNKIRGLGDYINEKISDSSTPQDFSADNLTGTYAALDGSQITDINPTNITGSGNLNIGNGDLFVDDTSGNVGIGTIVPDEKFHLVGKIKNTNEESTTDDYRPVQVLLEYTVNPGHIPDQTTDFHGLDLKTKTSISDPDLSNSRLYPFESSAIHEGESVLDEAYAGYLQVRNSYNGTINTSTNLRLWTQNVDPGGTIGNVRGLYMANPNNNGIINNVYGIYLGELTAGSNSNYAIYTAGTTPSYFGGNVGVGSTEPRSILDLKKASSASYSSSITDVNSYVPYPQELAIGNTENGGINSFTGIFFDAGDTSEGSGVNSARISAIRDGHIVTHLGFSTRESGGPMTEKLRITSGGNIGIGTTDPKAKLEVNGIIKTKERSSATCNADSKGGIYFDSDDNHFYGCNGTAWVQLDN